MVDYSRFDKIAALLSSSDDDDEDSEENRHEDLFRDKFNVCIHKDGQQSTTIHHSVDDNPYVDESLLTAQQHFNPQANAEFMAQYNGNDDRDEYELDDDHDDDADTAFLDTDFEEMAPVFMASTAMFKRHKTKYNEELKAMNSASELISVPESVRSDFQIEHGINQYSHEIPMDTLRLIFEFAINEKDPVPNNAWNERDQYDKDKDPRLFPLRLLTVCKNWRLCIMQNDQFWSPVIDWLVRGGSVREMTWKKLVLTPERYLRQFCRWYTVDKCSESERKEYLQLMEENGCLFDDDSDDMEWSGVGPGGFNEELNTNPFLLIQCLRICVNTYQVSVYGLLCDDLFYAIGTFCKSLRRLNVEYISKGNVHWFRHLVKDDSGCLDTLFEVNLGRSYWVTDQVLKYLGKLRNLQSVLMDRLYGVTARGLMHLFEGDNEMRNIHLTRGMRFANDTVQFMELMIKNGQKMVQLDFQECEGFHDGMLKLLEHPEALPELRALNVMYTACSQRAVDRLQKKRPALEIEFEEREW